MKKALLLILVAAIGGLLSWYFRRPQPVAVVLGTVERGAIESTVVNTRAGTVKACRRSLLAPASSGQIDRLLVREGMKVEAGAVLLSLWSKDLTAEVALSKSEVLAAEASARATCLESETATRQAVRYRTLQRDTVVSEEEADRITSAAPVRQAACESARTAVEVRQGQLQAAEARLARTVLVAPFAGVVAEVNGEVGEFVTPSPPGIPTLPAVDLVDDTCYYVSAPIDEVDAAAIRVGMAAKITMDAFSGRAFNGRVRRIADYVLDREKQARTVDIEVAFADPQEVPGLLPGYSADAEVILQTKANTVRIPTEALSTAGKAFVLLAAAQGQGQGQGRIEERTVQIGLANFEYTEIVSGLTEGERVLLTPDRKGVRHGALAKEEPAAVAPAP